MRVFALILLAGCSFEHGTVASGDGPTRMIDAPPTVIDARPIDARMIDAPPCPDDDSDGVCNNVDDWPCGAKPAAAASPVTFMNNGTATTTTVSMTDLHGTGVFAVAAPSSTISLAFRLQITDTACPGNCQDQLEAGWVAEATGTGNRFTTCLYDNAVSKTNGDDTNLAFNVGTPATGRVYDLRVNLGQNNFCGASGNNGWWPNNTVPAATRTIAKLCVH